jgi:hypothetical protein
MRAASKRERSVESVTREEPVVALRQATFVVWRGKLQSSLCVTARQIPTISPLAAWRVWEPSTQGVALVPRRRRQGC